MWTDRLRRSVRAFAFAAACALLLAPAAPTAIDAQTAAPPAWRLPPIKHVFLIVLENQTFDSTFGYTLPVPYLAKDVAGKGALLTEYYGTSHFSLGNYLSLISGQAVTRANQDDCATSSEYPELSWNYADIQQTGTAPFDQVVGDGCIYPKSTLTIADQLMQAGLTWHGYMEDMGNDPSRENATCGMPHDGVGKPDNTQYAQVPPTYNGKAHIQDQYAARHNPFVYFHSIIDSPACAKNVEALGTPQNSKLVTALKSPATTPNYVFITPNLCDDGHDTPCKAPGSPVGVHMYDPENAFLQRWVPIITRSPAFQQDGLLIITFDESSLAGTSASGVEVGYDGSGCCGEPSGPNTVTPGLPPLNAPQYRINTPYANEIITTRKDGVSGGGRIGAVLVSPFINPGQVSAKPYNHYSTLRTIEDIFGIKKHLGYAGYPTTPAFDKDVFGPVPQHFPVTL